MNLKDTISCLKYISDPKQPDKGYGGFNQTTREIAAEALRHIEKLIKKCKAKK
jgi:hypothetical protein